MSKPLRRRLARLEGSYGAMNKDREEIRRQEEQERRRIKASVEHAINCRTHRGEESYFAIADDGTPMTRDGRPVESTHQILAEEFYQMQLEDGKGGSTLVHDEEAEAFYTPEGELALSRTFCHLERLFRCL